MARFLQHSFPGRKLLLFTVEQAAVIPAALAGAAVASALAAGEVRLEGRAPLPWLLAAAAAGPERLAAALVLVGRTLHEGAIGRVADALPWALGAALGSAATLYAAELYNLQRAAEDRRAGGRKTLGALLATALALGLVAAPAGAAGRAAASGAVLAAALAVAGLRLCLPAIIGAPTRVLVVGAGRRALAVARALRAEPEANLALAGFACASPTLLERFPAHVRFRSDDGLLAAARRAGARWIVVAPDGTADGVAEAELVRCRVEGLECLTPAMLEERALRRIPVAGLRPGELAFSDGFGAGPGFERAKRALDVVTAAIGLVLALPLLAVAAVAIRLESPGPVLYRQTRVGRHGRVFEIVKLRTMRVDAEPGGAPRWAAERDPRVTRVGRVLRKTRVDEIPQILSVLQGEMSFVGPRPERPFFVEELKRRIPWYGLREAARPGLTGWAQLRHPYGASVEDARRKLEYDLYYLKNATLFLDVAILFHTVRHVLTGRGAR